MALLSAREQTALNEFPMGKERQFVVKERGEQVAVVIAIEEYEKILEELEDLEDIRAYDEARASGETGIPLEQAGPKFGAIAGALPGNCPAPGSKRT